MTCIVCGEGFQVKPYRRETARCCSRKCSHSDPIRLEKTATALKGRCVNPRTTFKKGHRQSVEAREKMSIAKIGKAPANKQPPVFIECQYCGQTKKVIPIYSDQRYCSKLCADKGKDAGKTAEQRKQRSSLAYRMWRTAVFERDNFTCRQCGTRGGRLNADHIKRFADYPDLRFNLDNGQTLCETCHRATPTYGNRTRQPSTSAVASG